LPERLAPSQPEGIEHGPVPAALSPLGAGTGRADAIQRGLVLHSLLQHLPALPPESRRDSARRFAARLAPDQAEEIADEALAVIETPALAPLFGPGARAEVPLTGVIGRHVIGGLVDRLVVLADQVMLCDYKTNRRAPDSVEATPVRYLRQMASYRALLTAIYPGHEIICILVWTHGGGAMTLPPDLLDRHAPGAGIAD
jgi:ATP-dependent helicase/nuclease subunit A